MHSLSTELHNNVSDDYEWSKWLIQLIKANHTVIDLMPKASERSSSNKIVVTNIYQYRCDSAIRTYTSLLLLRPFLPSCQNSSLKAKVGIFVICDFCTPENSINSCGNWV